MKTITIIFLATMLCIHTAGQSIGIGTANPQSLLHVANSDAEKLRLDNTTVLGAAVNSEMYFKTGNYFTGAIKTIGTAGNAARLGFFTFADPSKTTLFERLSIADGGNVGIGTITPSAKLDIAGSLRYADGSQGAGKQLTSDANGMATWQAAAGWLTTGNGGTNSSHFLGTTDLQPLRLRVNNAPAGFLDPISRNVAYGMGALKNNPGSEMVAIGDSALHNQSTNGGGFHYNTAVGTKALYSNIIGAFNTAIGYHALQLSTGFNNTAVGYNTLSKSTGGQQNTAVGTYALSSNTGGNNNIAVGLSSLSDNTTGHNNTAVGSNTLAGNTTGYSNIAIGVSALEFPSGNRNIVAIGDSALRSNTGGFNTAIGSKAMLSNTTGLQNVAIGIQAMYDNIGGLNNAAMGAYALANNTHGDFNTGIGYNALGTNVTGNQNTALGHSADVTATGLTNAMAIGYDAKVNASNKVRIGNTSVTVIEGQVAYSFPSDGRFKFNIRPNVPGLDFITRLIPVTYYFDTQKLAAFNTTGELVNNGLHNVTNGGQRRLLTGFVAQDVEKVTQQLGYDFDGLHIPENNKDHYSLAYSQFIVPMVKAMQEQQSIIETQQQNIDTMQALISKMQERIQKLEAINGKK